jgi:hypothetical protein
MTDRRAFLLGGLAAAGCAPTPGPRLAADPLPPAEGGIGGTGIVGVVTGRGSVRLNGLRVGLEGARVESAFGPLDASALRPGHSLTIEAVGPAGALRAARVRLTQPLVGPVEAVDRATRRLVVAGATVALEPGLTPLWSIGERVAVSGLWRGTTVVASRIDPAPAAGPDAVSGALRRLDGGWAVNGARIAPPAGARLAEGAFATALGRVRDGALEVASLTEGRFAGGGAPLARLSVEGYLERAPRAPGFALSGLGHSFDAAARLGALEGRRAVFAGGYDGDFVVAEAIPLPEGAAARARALAPGATAPVPTR